jgi:DNA-binding beta-propeller fold protein YncE
MKKYNSIRYIITGLILVATSFNGNGQDGAMMIRQWGEFGDKPGQMKFPTMIAADKNSDIYVVDQHNHRIQKFDKDGNFILMWGKNGDGDGEFNFPYGIAVDSKGNVFVSDMNNNRIQKFTGTGVFVAKTGSYGTADGQLKYPYGIVVDENDIVYVIDAFNYRVQKFSSDLKFLSKWGDQESIGFKLYMPHEIAVSKEGNLILSDRQNHRISVFSKDGAPVKRFGDFGEGDNIEGGLFSEPHGVAVNENGDIFVCDRYNFRIQKFDQGMKYQSHWVTPGPPDNSKHFPMGVAASGECVYVTDQFQHCIQKYSVSR